MMLKTLIEQSCTRENDFLQYCTVGEDYFKLMVVRLAWRQDRLSFMSTWFPHLSRDGGKCRRL